MRTVLFKVKKNKLSKCLMTINMKWTKTIETKMFLEHCWNPAECVCNWMSIEVKKIKIYRNSLKIKQFDKLQAKKCLHIDQNIQIKFKLNCLAITRYYTYLRGPPERS